MVGHRSSTWESTWHVCVARSMARKGKYGHIINPTRERDTLYT